MLFSPFTNQILLYQIQGEKQDQTFLAAGHVHENCNPGEAERIVFSVRDSLFFAGYCSEFIEFLV
jgi:hypothetical protein